MNRRRMLRTRFIAPLLICGTAIFSGCSVQSADDASGSGSSPRRDTVVIVGDSLAEQAAQYLPFTLPGKTLVSNVLGGTAPCDWFGKELGITGQSIVLISFTGNSMSPCMADGAGGYLRGQAIADRYRTDVPILIDQIRAADGTVLIVGQPVHSNPDPTFDVVAQINLDYQALAAAGDIDFVDAGSMVENADGSLAMHLPCLDGEPACGADGTNIVRNDDGLHFCPGTAPPGPCAEYASGAYRFALGMAQSANQH